MLVCVEGGWRELGAARWGAGGRGPLARGASRADSHRTFSRADFLGHSAKVECRRGAESVTKEQRRESPPDWPALVGKSLLKPNLFSGPSHSGAHVAHLSPPCDLTHASWSDQSRQPSHQPDEARRECPDSSCRPPDDPIAARGREHRCAPLL